ncbi:MAG: hypothetical protein ACOX3Z_05110 [Bacillota bacterium]
MIYRLVIIGLAILVVLTIQKILYMVEVFFRVPPNLFMAVPAVAITIAGYFGALCVRKYRIKSKMKKDMLLWLTVTALMLNPAAWLVISTMKHDKLGCIISLALVLVNSHIAHRLVKRISSWGSVKSK